MNNGLEPPTSLDFDQSIDHNIAWIKQIALDHDCSQGIAATAALMTMTMMDHYNLNKIIVQIQSDLETIRAELCQSNS